MVTYGGVQHYRTPHDMFFFSGFPFGDHHHHHPYNVRPPSDVSWFLSPSNYSYLRTINHSEIGVMFTNLAIKRGPHIVRSFSLLKDLEPPKMEAQ